MISPMAGCALAYQVLYIRHAFLRVNEMVIDDVSMRITIVNLCYYYNEDIMCFFVLIGKLLNYRSYFKLFL